MSIARGRARGRGLVKKFIEDQKPGLQNGNHTPIVTSPVGKPTPEKSQIPSNHPESQFSSEVISLKTVEEIVKKMERMTASEILKKIPDEINQIKSNENCQTFISLVIENALNDPDFAKTAAKLFNILWNHNEISICFKTPLLTLVQKFYTKRTELKKDIEKFHGLCVLICELFRFLRVKDKPLKPLIAAVSQLLKELMSEEHKATSEDVLYFYQELESVGEILQQTNEKELEEIINVARQTVISSVDMLPSVRCRLIQVIELAASNWKMSDQLKLSYDELQHDLLTTGK